MNVQNIPRESRIRNVFVAAPGFVFVEADYSQAEIRVLAELSKDKYLTQVFLDGRDLHSEMAREIFGENFTKEDRSKAKEVNFGVPYGLTDSGLAIRFNISVESARGIIKRWFEAAPQAGDYINLCRQAPILRRTLVTPFHRRRRFGFVTMENLHQLQNEACNFPISSTASDLTLHSAISLGKVFKERWGNSVRIVNIVHDSILAEVSTDCDIEGVSGTMINVMENIPQKLIGATVPFVADIKMGSRWGSLNATGGAN